LLAYLLAVVVILVAALLAFGLAALLNLHGTAYLIFVVVLLLIGVAAAVTILVLHFRARKEKHLEGDSSGSGGSTELDLLLNDANRKLRTSQQGAKTLESLPLIYILGDAGAAKTTTVVQSGLDPELLVGSASPTNEQTPTQVINLWFSKQAALLEVGAAVRESNNLFERLVHRTRAKAYRSAFGTGAAPRAVIVCLSMDQLLVADAGASLMASARATGTQLRDLSRLLGMPVAVYVFVTKIDRVAHFDKYASNLTDEEVRQILGSPLPRSEASVGTYAEQASKMLASVIDGLVYQLGEFRVEMLDRENEARNGSGVYEFPREFGKVRKGLNQYLVELCKPSQLSANPYLRGVYFTGARARVVERAAAAPAVPERAIAQDAGATQYLKISTGHSGYAARAAAPIMVSSRIPQWTFLPRLLPEVVLGDKSALSSSRQTAPARLFRRILFGSLAFLFALYCLFLIVSYVNNAALEHRIRNVARAIPSVDAGSSSLPGLSDLRALDELRQTIVLLDGYQQKGAPLRYRFGLYQGGKLDTEARRIYFDRFRPMLLNPAQTNLIGYMRALPEAPAATSDFSSYTSAYNPLKAYLITTGNPEKSQTKFLTPVLLQFWTGTRQTDSEQQQLAQRQLDFYGNELLRQPPYAIVPDSGVVEHTRAFLSRFLAETRIYQGMLTDADKTNPTIDFNKQYPGSADYVLETHVIRGAFSKAGFGFMQDALQHPERYAQGETWVLGNQAGGSLNTSAISRDLTAQYTTDFLKEWHTFLISAHVASCLNLKEAPARLNALAGPASPLLSLFSVVSRNTAVADPQIKSTFQPAQALVDPNATDRVIGPGNQPYVTALSQLAGAVDLASQNPAPMDAAAFAPISQQVVAAGGAAQQAAQAFNVDQQTHTEGTVLALMQAPIQCVAKLAPSPGAPANGGGAKICSAISPLLNKFPFASNSQVQAPLPEVDAVFAPEAGALWASYNGALKPFMLQQGSQFVPSPSAPQPLNPRFVQYFNRAAHVSSELYAPGQKTASLAFTLRFIPGTGVSSATLVVDGQKAAAGSTTQQYKWNGPEAQRASLVYDNNEPLVYQGTWSLFQLVRTAQISRTGGGYRLDYVINTATTVAGHTVGGSSGAAKTATFELSGPGADLLVSDGFSGLSCVTPAVK
jgi:type VI secretion system protein ImpL